MPCFRIATATRALTKLFLHLHVAFKISWRRVSELFGVMFQDYLAYTASACADHKTVPRRFNYFIGDEVKVVNSENPFNLGEESS
jgi:hypothetical protein